MNLRERIENNLAVWLLSTLLTGFLAGIGTYKAILDIAQLKTISAGEYDRLRAEPSAKPNISSATQSVFLSPDNVIIVPGFNFAVRLDSERNYNPETHAIEIYLCYRPDPNDSITEENKGSMETEVQWHWIVPESPTFVQVGGIGAFTITLTKPRFDSKAKRVEGVTVLVAKRT